MEIDCDANNWQDVCRELKKRKHEIIKKYDVKCFYVALSSEGIPQEFLFWRCNTKNQKRMAGFLMEIFFYCSSDDYEYSERQLKCGFLNYAKLQRRLENGTIAYDAGWHRDDYYPNDFQPVDLTAKEFPTVKLKCLKNHVCDRDWKNVQISEKEFHISVSAIIDLLVRHYNDRYRFEDTIEEIFVMFEQHNKEDCKKIATSSQKECNNSKKI